jgi:hypothetical protein
MICWVSSAFNGVALVGVEWWGLRWCREGSFIFLASDFASITEKIGLYQQLTNGRSCPKSGDLTLNREQNVQGNLG